MNREMLMLVEAISREKNVDREYERNGERYRFFRWAQGAFGRLRVVPPGMGIVHQVNVEHIATVVDVRDHEGGRVALPDTLEIGRAHV